MTIINTDLNGVKTSTETFFSPNNVKRTTNFFGKSNWNGAPNTNAIYDEIKIYSGAMSDAQVLNDFKNIGGFTLFLNLSLFFKDKNYF